jgi:hypothetical protein
MSKSKTLTIQVGLDAQNGKFITVTEAKLRKSIAVVETFKRARKSK